MFRIACVALLVVPILVYGSGIPEGCPKTLTVQGAGSKEANGDYVATSTFNGKPWYKSKTMEICWNARKQQWWLLRQKGQTKLYKHTKVTDFPAGKETSGWLVFYGATPPPTILAGKTIKDDNVKPSTACDMQEAMDTEVKEAMDKRLKVGDVAMYRDGWYGYVKNVYPDEAQTEYDIVWSNGASRKCVQGDLEKVKTPKLKIGDHFKCPGKLIGAGNGLYKGEIERIGWDPNDEQILYWVQWENKNWKNKIWLGEVSHAIEKAEETRRRRLVFPPLWELYELTRQ